MMRLATFAIGLLFGFGLLLSGMTQPAKVLGFLDIFGRFDPSLALVMGGGLIVSFAGFRLAKGRARSLIGETMHLPLRSAVDARLVAGSLLFGVGWGLSGICPGPGLVNLGFFDANAAIFVVAMLIGMGICAVLSRYIGTQAQIAEEEG